MNLRQSSGLWLSALNVGPLQFKQEDDDTKLFKIHMERWYVKKK